MDGKVFPIALSGKGPDFIRPPTCKKQGTGPSAASRYGESSRAGFNQKRFNAAGTGVHVCENVQWRLGNCPRIRKGSWCLKLKFHVPAAFPSSVAPLDKSRSCESVCNGGVHIISSPTPDVSGHPCSSSAMEGFGKSGPAGQPRHGRVNPPPGYVYKGLCSRYRKSTCSHPGVQALRGVKLESPAWVVTELNGVSLLGGCPPCT